MDKDKYLRLKKYYRSKVSGTLDTYEDIFHSHYIKFAENKKQKLRYFLSDIIKKQNKSLLTPNIEYYAKSYYDTNDHDFNSMIRFLEPRSKTIIRSIFQEGKNYLEVAREMKIHPTEVQMIYRDSLRKLRSHLIDELIE